jgi:hypothetical protein
MSINAKLCALIPAVSTSLKQRQRNGNEADALLLQAIIDVFNDAIAEILDILTKNSYTR